MQVLAKLFRWAWEGLRQVCNRETTNIEVENVNFAYQRLLGEYVENVAQFAILSRENASQDTTIETELQKEFELLQNEHESKMEQINKYYDASLRVAENRADELEEQLERKTEIYEKNKNEINALCQSLNVEDSTSENTRDKHDEATVQGEFETENVSEDSDTD